MTVDKAVAPRRMHVSRGIGVQVVLPVLGGPPQNAFLRARLGKKRKDELESPARRVGMVREIPVVARADRKYAQPIERRAEHDGLPRDPRPDRSKASQMHRYEGQGGRKDDVILRAIRLDV